MLLLDTEFHERTASKAAIAATNGLRFIMELVKVLLIDLQPESTILRETEILC